MNALNSIDSAAIAEALVICKEQRARQGLDPTVRRTLDDRITRLSGAKPCRKLASQVLQHARDPKVIKGKFHPDDQQPE